MKNTTIALALGLAAALPLAAQAETALPPNTFIAEEAPVQYLARDRLIGTKVKGPDGKIIGDIEDIILSGDHQVSGVVMGTGGYFGLFEKKVGVNISAIQFDVVDGKIEATLPGATAAVIEAAPAYVRGQPKKSLFERAVEKTREIRDKTGASAKDAYQDVKEKAAPAIESAKEKAKEALDNAGPAVQKAREAAKEAIETAKEKAKEVVDKAKGTVDAAKDAAKPAETAPAPSAPAAEATPAPAPVAESKPEPAAEQPKNEAAAVTADSAPAPQANAAGDDLLNIRGLDEALRDRLNALGVKTYEQISKWTDDDVVRFEKDLAISDRIAKENWREQAKVLSEGGQTAYSLERAGQGTKPAQ